MWQPFHKQTILEYLWQFPIGINIWISNFREFIWRGGGKDQIGFIIFLTYSLMELSLTVVSHIMNKIFTSFL